MTLRRLAPQRQTYFSNIMIRATPIRPYSYSFFVDVMRKIKLFFDDFLNVRIAFLHSKSAQYFALCIKAKDM